MLIIISVNDQDLGDQIVNGLKGFASMTDDLHINKVDEGGPQVYDIVPAEQNLGVNKADAIRHLMNIEGLK